MEGTVDLSRRSLHTSQNQDVINTSLHDQTKSINFNAVETSVRQTGGKSQTTREATMGKCNPHHHTHTPTHSLEMEKEEEALLRQNKNSL